MNKNCFFNKKIISNESFESSHNVVDLNISHFGKDDYAEKNVTNNFFNKEDLVRDNLNMPVFHSCHNDRGSINRRRNYIIDPPKTLIIGPFSPFSIYRTFGIISPYINN